MNYKNWTKKFFIYLTILAGIIGTFNFIVDYNGIFDVFEIKGFNENKTKSTGERLSSFYYCNRLKPDTLLIGTSRIGTMHPDDVQRYTKDKVYNLTLAGSTSYEQSLYLEYMIKHHKIKTVIVGLDFFSYLPNKLIQEGFSVDRLTQPVYFKDYTDALLSINGLSRSQKTITDNIAGALLEKDYKNGWNTFYHGKEKLDKEGDRYIRNMIVRTIKDYKRDYYANQKFRDINTTYPYLAYLKNMVKLAKDNNINLILYISPIYCQHFDLIYTLGLGNTFEEWKRQIALLSNYYDFTGHNSITTDMKWWWDTSHINRNGNKLVVDKIFNNGHSYPDFGMLVNANNVDAHLLNLRKDIKQENLKSIASIIEK